MLADETEKNNGIAERLIYKGFLAMSCYALKRHIEGGLRYQFQKP